MHDTLAYFSMDPVHRKHHHDLISFAMMYAYSEHFVLSLSHDEVVHGKGALYSKMWGDDWQKRANLRALYALMFSHPGRKLLFMGSEIAPSTEWHHDRELDWSLLENPGRAGVAKLVRDLNHLYRKRSALHARDDEPGGFAWIEVCDATQSIYSFVRYGRPPGPPMVVICNFTPVVHPAYRLGLPLSCNWREVLNTDHADYGGSGVTNSAGVVSSSVAWQGHACSVEICLPPLGVVWLEPASGA